MFFHWKRVRVPLRFSVSSAHCHHLLFVWFIPLIFLILLFVFSLSHFYLSLYSTALQVESIVRKNGAVPATIGIIDGKVFVGLQRQQLEQLATLKGRQQQKGTLLRGRTKLYLVFTFFKAVFLECWHLHRMRESETKFASSSKASSVIEGESERQYEIVKEWGIGITLPWCPMEI